jgi:uncharacterized protein (TIGR02996 family)
MNDQESFLSAILSSPEDDTPRLVYADWLDEHSGERVPCPRCNGGSIVWSGSQKKGGPYEGPKRKHIIEPLVSALVTCPVCKGTGTILDTANAGRAEFIRLQCREKSFPCECVSGSVEMQYDCPTCVGNARESALLATYGDQWRVGPKCVQCGGDGWMSHRPSGHEPCPTCFGTGDAGGLLREFEYRSPPSYAGQQYVTASTTPVRLRYARGFPDCVEVPTLAESHYELRPTPWAISVVRHHPVMRFVPLDYEQYLMTYDGTKYWWRDYGIYISNPRLPTAFCPTDSYPTRDAAVDALALALARFVRNHLTESTK